MGALWITLNSSAKETTHDGQLISSSHSVTSLSSAGLGGFFHSVSGLLPFRFPRCGEGSRWVVSVVPLVLYSFPCSPCRSKPTTAPSSRDPSPRHCHPPRPGRRQPPSSPPKEVARESRHSPSAPIPPLRRGPGSDFWCPGVSAGRSG